MTGTVSWFDPNYQQAVIQFLNPDGTRLGERSVLRHRDTRDSPEEFARKYAKGNQVEGKPAPVYREVFGDADYICSGWNDPRFERHQ